jgi:hypothetical protein
LDAFYPKKSQKHFVMTGGKVFRKSADRQRLSRQRRAANTRRFPFTRVLTTFAIQMNHN